MNGFMEAGRAAGVDEETLVLWKATSIFRENRERNIEMYQIRKSGKTLKEIGDLYGISRERVRQICWLIDRRMEKARNDL